MLHIRVKETTTDSEQIRIAKLEFVTATGSREPTSAQSIKRG
jgi:hypothetical protein